MIKKNRKEVLLNSLKGLVLGVVVGTPYVGRKSGEFRCNGVDKVGRMPQGELNEDISLIIEVLSKYKTKEDLLQKLPYHTSHFDLRTNSRPLLWSLVLAIVLLEEKDTTQRRLWVCRISDSLHEAPITRQYTFAMEEVFRDMIFTGESNIRYVKANDDDCQIKKDFSLVFHAYTASFSYNYSLLKELRKIVDQGCNTDIKAGLLGALLSFNKKITLQSWSKVNNHNKIESILSTFIDNVHESNVGFSKG